MDKKIAKRIAIVLCGVALTGVGATSIIKENTYTASANSQGSKYWIQYGTLKYDLRGPSGRIYKAGTRVVRTSGTNEKPPMSIPKGPFNLTLIIGGMPGNNLLQDTGGGSIAESFVNIEGDWSEIDYPPQSTALVNNTSDYTDLKSSDFHPVDPNNPDVPYANLDALMKAYADLGDIAQHDSVKGKDREVIYALNDRYMEAKKIGVTQETVDQLTSDIEKVVAQYKKTGHLTGVPDNTGTPTKPDTDKPANGDITTTTNPGPTTTSKQSRYVRLRKASYRYTRKGKRVSRKLLKKGSVVKINGKVYRIKGKTFYRIAKNRYIRVVNVVK